MITIRDDFPDAEGTAGVEVGLGDDFGDVVGVGAVSGETVGESVGVGAVSGEIGGVASWETITS
jgi:hypothetical protein